MINVKEKRTDHMMALGYRLRHRRSVISCSASSIALCGVARDGCDRHGAAELYVVSVTYVVFVSVEVRSVSSEPSEQPLVGCGPDAGDVCPLSI
jgi:hypothetical protein